VLLPIRIEVRTSGLEIRCFAFRVLMEMNGVFAGGQSVEVEFEFDAGGKGLDLHVPTSLPVASLTSTVIPPPLAMPLVDTKENRRNSRMVFFMLLVGCVSEGR